MLGLIVAPGQWLGRIGFAAGKLWMVGLPLVWHLAVDRGSLRPRRPSAAGLLAGALSGIAVGGIIIAAYWAFGVGLIDHAHARTIARALGLATLPAYLAGCAYWVGVNSLFEELVYRVFAVEQGRHLVPVPAAVILSAALFTVHHTVALAWQFGAAVGVIGSIGVFTGGALWSWLYARFRSVWPGYVSHAIVDVAVFAVGYRIIFE